MPTALATGTQAAVISTEHTLATDTSNKNVVLAVDLNALAAGDIVELRLKTKVLSGGTSRLAWYKAYANAQGVPNVYSIPIPANIEVVATLKQTAGTGRSFPWALLSVN